MADGLWRLDAGGIAIARQHLEPIYILRLRRGDAALVARLEHLLGQLLPRVPNRCTSGEWRIAWIAPSEWMIAGRKPLPAGIANLLAEQTAHLADVGDGRVQFVVSGNASRDLLAKGTSIDLHHRVFGATHCARTLFAQTLVLIEHETGDDAFRITADASLASHLERWFTEAAREFA